MFSFLCRFAPYCLNFSDHALTNTANHNGTRDRVIWKAQQVINLWDFYSLSALGWNVGLEKVGNLQISPFPTISDDKPIAFVQLPAGMWKQSRR